MLGCSLPGEACCCVAIATSSLPWSCHYYLIMLLPLAVKTGCQAGPRKPSVVTTASTGQKGSGQGYKGPATCRSSFPYIKESGAETQEEARQTQSCFLRDSRNLDRGPAIDSNQIARLSDGEMRQRKRTSDGSSLTQGQQGEQRPPAPRIQLGTVAQPKGLAFGAGSGFHPFPASSP